MVVVIITILIWIILALTRYRRWNRIGRVDEWMVMLKMVTMMDIIFGCDEISVMLFDNAVAGPLIAIAICCIVHLLVGKYKWTL